jgi:hypothetical protein
MGFNDKFALQKSEQSLSALGLGCSLIRGALALPVTELRCVRLPPFSVSSTSDSDRAVRIAAIEVSLLLFGVALNLGAVLRDELQNHVQITAGWSKVLSSCHVGGGFHPHLKCLKRLTTLLPDGAARIANDECRSGVNALMKIGA